MVVEKMNGFNLRNWLNLSLDITIGNYKFIKGVGEITANVISLDEKNNIAQIGIMFQSDSVKRYFGYTIEESFSFVEEEILHLCESLLSHINGKKVEKKIQPMQLHKWHRIPIGYRKCGIRKISDTQAVSDFGIIIVNNDGMVKATEDQILRMLKFLRW